MYFVTCCIKNGDNEEKLIRKTEAQEIFGFFVCDIIKKREYRLLTYIGKLGKSRRNEKEDWI